MAEQVRALPDRHGLPGDDCEVICHHSGEATHCPIGVNANGEGPVMPHEPGYDRTICWCDRPGCTRYEERTHD